MAYCKARLDLATGGELNCFLDEGHEPVLRAHYDQLNGVMWYINNEPSAVPHTPTGPMKAVKAGK